MIYHRQPLCFEPGPFMKIHQFLSPSPGQQKSEKLLPRLPKTMKKRSRNHKNSDFCEKVVFATPLTPKACFRSPRRPDLDSKIGAKSDLETSTKNNTDFSPQGPKSSQNGVPKSHQNRSKSDSGPQGVLPAAPMVPQGAPKVPK